MLPQSAASLRDGLLTIVLIGVFIHNNYSFLSTYVSFPSTYEGSSMISETSSVDMRRLNVAISHLSARSSVRRSIEPPLRASAERNSSGTPAPKSVRWGKRIYTLRTHKELPSRNLQSAAVCEPPCPPAMPKWTPLQKSQCQNGHLSILVGDRPVGEFFRERIWVGESLEGSSAVPRV